MLHIKRHIRVMPIKSIQRDMYVAPSSVSVCYAFDIDKIDSVVFAKNRCMCVPKKY